VPVPIVRSDDAPEFDMNGIHVVGLSSPKRGATEITSALVTMSTGQVIPPHVHDHEEVVHVLSGRLRFLLDGEEMVLEPGDTAIVNAGSTHSPEGAAPDGGTS
jgi:quercetin dioxygenase-like cupin family protein